MDSNSSRAGAALSRDGQGDPLSIDMVECVAKALYALSPIGVRTWEDCPSFEAAAHRAQARAAIAAMREPTRDMLDASRRALGQHIRSLPASERTPKKGYAGGFIVHDEYLKARVRYQAMIDAALAKAEA